MSSCTLDLSGTILYSEHIQSCGAFKCLVSISGGHASHLFDSSPFTVTLLPCHCGDSVCHYGNSIFCIPWTEWLAEQIVKGSSTISVKYFIMTSSLQQYLCHHVSDEGGGSSYYSTFTSCVKWMWSHCPMPSLHTLSPIPAELPVSADGPDLGGGCWGGGALQLAAVPRKRHPRPPFWDWSKMWTTFRIWGPNFSTTTLGWACTAGMWWGRVQ